MQTKHRYYVDCESANSVEQLLQFHCSCLGGGLSCPTYSMWYNPHATLVDPEESSINNFRKNIYIPTDPNSPALPELHCKKRLVVLTTEWLPWFQETVVMTSLFGIRG